MATNETLYNSYHRWRTGGIGNYSHRLIRRIWDQGPEPKGGFYCHICQTLFDGRPLRNGIPPDGCTKRDLTRWIRP